MAHRLKVDIVPYVKKDGSLSTGKQQYVLYDFTRGRKVFKGKATSKSGIDQLILDVRTGIIEEHAIKHPNDLAFRRKHKLVTL